MNLKLLSGCVYCLAGALLLGAEKPGPEIRLRGIVDFSTNELALLEATTLPGWPGEMILVKGQREEDIEVLEIDAAAGKVKIRNAGNISEIGFTTDLPPAAWVQSPSGHKGLNPKKDRPFFDCSRQGQAMSSDSTNSWLGAV